VSDSSFRDLSFVLRNAQGDFFDLAQGLLFVAVLSFLFPFVWRSITFRSRFGLRIVFLLFFLFFFGGNGRLFDALILSVAFGCTEFCFFVQFLYCFTYKHKFLLMNSLSSRLLTISQALHAGRPSVSFSGAQLAKRNSRQRQVLSILLREGFFTSFAQHGTGSQCILTVFFAYTAAGLPVLRRRYRVSKPSRRVYLPSAAL